MDCLGDLIPDLVSLAGTRPVGGGCISQANRVEATLRDGRCESWLVKTNDVSFEPNFRREYEGLEALAAAATIAVAEPVAVGIAGGRAVIVTRFVETSSRPGGFFASFGTELASLHDATRGDGHGWPRDNYLGASDQINQSRSSWVEFVAENRLDFQLRRIVDLGRSSTRLTRSVETVITRLDDLLSGRDEGTSLLHGDLWSGNYLCGPDGRAVLIDPAVHRGCHEAEFGMLMLFGGCPENFYDAYQDRLPMPAGWQRRARVYVLYHLLNHLQLFGGGYLNECESAATELLKTEN